MIEEVRLNQNSRDKYGNKHVQLCPVSIIQTHPFHCKILTGERLLDETVRQS